MSKAIRIQLLSSDQNLKKAPRPRVKFNPAPRLSAFGHISSRSPGLEIHNKRKKNTIEYYAKWSFSGSVIDA